MNSPNLVVLYWVGHWVGKPTVPGVSNNQVSQQETYWVNSIKCTLSHWISRRGIKLSFFPFIFVFFFLIILFHTSFIHIYDEIINLLIPPVWLTHLFLVNLTGWSTESYYGFWFRHYVLGHTITILQLGGSQMAFYFLDLVGVLIWDDAQTRPEARDTPCIWQGARGLDFTNYNIKVWVIGCEQTIQRYTFPILYVSGYHSWYVLKCSFGLLKLCHPEPR